MDSQIDASRPEDAHRLLRQVVRRLQFAAFGHAWFSFALALSGVCLVILLVRRLSGWGPDWLVTEMLLVLFLGATLLTFLMYRKVANSEAARRIDCSLKTHDLFLTLVQLEASAGKYQPMVARQAGEQAAGGLPSVVVPWFWQRRIAVLSASFGVLVTASMFLPQLDPFGSMDSASTAVAVRKDLQNSRRETNSRLAELSTRQQAASFSGEVNQTLSELAAELKKLTNDRSAANVGDLDARQREIEARWQEARNSAEVSRVLEQAQTTQFLGTSDQQSQQWVDELAEGHSESIDQVFDQLNSDLEKLASTGDADEQELEKQIRQAMARLQRFAGNQLQSQPMETAMKRAMGQLDSSRLDPALKSEAIEAAKESVELAQNELQEVAKEAEQLASLEQALDAIQSAKQMAQQKSSQSSETRGQNEKTIQDFVEQYADLQGESCNQQAGNDAPESGQNQSGKSGQQMASAKGRSGSDSAGKLSGSRPDQESNNSASDSDSEQNGAGRSVARENAATKTEFRDSREAAALDASRRLMTMRRQGLSESGTGSQEYQELVKSLQKRVSTAIEVEEIPPGYVSGIRSYFDSLGQRVAGNGGESSEAGNFGEGKSADNSSEAPDEVP